MSSLVHKGFVYHARLRPKVHAFEYPVFFLQLELDELPRLDRLWPLFGYNRKAILSVWDRDYLDHRDGSWRDKAMRILREHGCADGVAGLRAVTCARYFGYVFNPVSFYYALGHDGSVTCAIAEVNNTFGERHVYVLPSPARRDDGSTLLSFTAAKDFHVSPFNDMRGQYSFEMSPPGPGIDIRVDLARDGETIMRTRMAGAGTPITRGSLAAVLMRYPVTALLTYPRIVAQATRLYWKRKLRVFHKPVPSSDMTVRTAPPTLWQRLCRRLVVSYLSRIRNGRLELHDPDGTSTGWGDPDRGRRIRVRVRDHRMFVRLAKDGDIGLAESFMHGEWDADDLTGLIELFIANRGVLDHGEPAWAVIGRKLNRLLHAIRRNTKAGSRRNIESHYDLGNDFFRLFLDPSMMYSCALYERGNETLEEAQRAKLRALIRKARIGPDHHVLEIGSGWGAFAIEAARETGCRVTTITISRKQFDLATERVREAGLSDRIDVRLCDYREITGSYDRIVSIEMLEAVGHEFLEEYFRVCDRVLKPGGLVALQVITIPDARYDAYRESVDFIQKHIFPGGHLPSLGSLRGAMSRGSRFAVENLENIGVHYARTLREWRDRFLQSRVEVARLGFDDTFVRKWLYYFSYCEAAFATRALDNHHLVLARNGDTLK